MLTDTWDRYLPADSDVSSTCPLKDAKSVFSLRESAGVSFGHEVGATAVLPKYSKAQSFSHGREKLFARCLKQWVTTPAHKAHCSVLVTTCRPPSYRISFCSPSGFLLPSPRLRSTLSPFSTPSCLLPLEPLRLHGSLWLFVNPKSHTAL